MPHKHVDRLPGRRWSWGEIAVVTGVVGVVVVGALAWERTGHWRTPDFESFSNWLKQYDTAWYALPLVAAAFTILGLALVPVLLMVAATGVAFGPWLGPPYAMVGCLVSASAGFGIGRWAGRERVQSVGGERVRRLMRSLHRNGTLAVFFLRKIPAPFMLSNIVAGASGVHYRDFLLGTLLGMGAFVVALAGFGYQIRLVIREPTPTLVLTAAAFLLLPFAFAWIVNRRLKSRHGSHLTRAGSPF